MATQVELQVSLNILVGGVPVALAASIDQQGAQTVYTFDGSVQSATLPLGRFISLLASQFGVAAQLPPELNLDVEIDYVVGQVIYTKPASSVAALPGNSMAASGEAVGDNATPGATTQLAAAGKFEITVDGETLTLQCFVAAELDSNSTTGSPYVVGASIGMNLPFASLPLVGHIPGFNELTLQQLGFSYSNVPTGTTPPIFQIPQVTATDNPLYTRTDPNAPEAKVYTITSAAAPSNVSLTTGGFSITVGLVNSTTGATMNNFALPLSMPSSPPPATLPPPAPFYTAGATSPPAGPIHWITINKTFGPVNLQQIGLNYSSGAATFGFSAGFALGGFSMDLEGLSITFPVSSTSTQGISFELLGMSMGFTEGPLSINGAFLKTATPPISYYGEVAVHAATFGFQALGGYTPATKSFFLYMNIEVPLGGPPFLFVTGLAGGFGVNTALNLPTFDTLSSCLLLPQNAPAQAATPSLTMQTIIPQLEGLFTPEAGEYWIAAGVQFTSFEMITAFALVTVEFGVDLQIGLLGSCSMSLPIDEPLAYVEVDLLASFSSSSGLFAVMGKLSPASNLYGGFCKLTGGFAFYIWVSGDSRGDFMVSLGGYSTSYSKPAIYPAVPRLGLSFGLGPFQATGQCYFALVPSMMMAGISISVTWSSGGIKVWLDMGVDFMISWAPLMYTGYAYVMIGCSVNLGLFTLKVQIGADLTIWGPQFGGRADVDLDIVSFTIGFGSSSPPAVAPLGWSGFKSALLPADSPASSSAQKNRAMRRRALRNTPGLAMAAAAPDTVSNVIKASVQEGLLQSGITGSDGEFYDWVLSPSNFAILTNSSFPANNARWTITGGLATIPPTVSSYNVTPVNTSLGPYPVLAPLQKTFSATQVWNPDLSIAPMKLTGVQSYQTITLMRHAETDPVGQFTEVVTSISVDPQLMNLNAGTWAPDPKQHTGDEPAMVDFGLTGFLLTQIPRKPDSTSAVPILELLFEEGISTGFAYTSQQVSTEYTVTSSIDPKTFALTIGISKGYDASMKNQGYVLCALANSWVTSQRSAVLTDLENNGFSTYTPAQVDLVAMSTETALNNWPGVALLGGE